VVAYVGVFFSCVGLALAAVGSWLFFEARRFARGAAQAPGVVVALHARKSRMRMRRWRWHHLSQYIYFPVVRYRPGDGAEIVSESTTGSNPTPYRVGSQVTVLYDPNNPSRVRVDSFLSRTAVPLFVASMGAAFAVLGLVLLVTGPG
jgi:hypothetical protein